MRDSYQPEEYKESMYGLRRNLIVPSGDYIGFLLVGMRVKSYILETAIALSVHNEI